MSCVDDKITRTTIYERLEDDGSGVDSLHILTHDSGFIISIRIAFRLLSQMFCLPAEIRAKYREREREKKEHIFFVAIRDPRE